MTANPLHVVCPECGASFGRPCWDLELPKIGVGFQTRKETHPKRARAADDVARWAEQSKKKAG